jgi:alanyl-tRNA synthetase
MMHHAPQDGGGGCLLLIQVQYSSRHVTLFCMQGVALIVPWWVQHAVPWAVAFITGGTASDQPRVKPH